jgi:hypothetical protein
MSSGRLVWTRLTRSATGKATSTGPAATTRGGGTAHSRTGTISTSTAEAATAEPEELADEDDELDEGLRERDRDLSLWRSSRPRSAATAFETAMRRARRAPMRICSRACFRMIRARDASSTAMRSMTGTTQSKRTTLD